MTREQWAVIWPLAKAFAEGKDVEEQIIGSEPEQWVVSKNPDFNSDTNWRIKPEPKIRDFKPEEVPVGALFRWSACERPVLIEWRCFSRKRGRMQASEMTHGNTWLPFGMPE